MRYVDNTFVVIKKDFGQEFTDHINSLNPNIKFTNDPIVDGKLPFFGHIGKTASGRECENQCV